MPVKVKICGITSPQDARWAVECGADAIGVNFYQKSPRAVTIAGAVEIARSVRPASCLVGVFVNAPREQIVHVAREVGLSAVQFHGDESPGDCLGWEPLIVIKALPAEGKDPLVERAARYGTAYVLVDTASRMYGGTGRTFDWEAAAGLPRDRLIVAGGLTVENVAEAIRTIRPLGVDVASGVEQAPGRKDHEKLKAFIRAAQAA